MNIPPAPTPIRRRNTTNHRIVRQAQTVALTLTTHAPTVTITRPPKPPTDWWKVARRIVTGYRVGEMIGKGIVWGLENFRKRANA